MHEAPPDALAAWSYDLPLDRIADHPVEPRDQAKLLVVRGAAHHDRRVEALPDLLESGDLVVANDSRVMPARCLLRRESGGRVEVLFLQATAGPVEALVRPTRRLRQGERLVHEEDGEVELVLVEHLGEGVWKVEARPSPLDLMARVGSTPLPPYIRRAAHSGDVRRYQTVFARDFGSSAAPTAGLHLTQALIARLAERGVGFATITLHVGIGTFRPLQQMDLDRGELHRESYFVSAETSGRIAETRARGARVLAVGTTTMRTLESAWDERTGAPRPGPGETRLFIREGHVFRSFDAFLTNFHLPRSSLLVLVGAWLGRDRLLEAYRHAITHGYRFYSYGDAMLVL